MENINELMTPVFVLFNFERIEDIEYKMADAEYLKDVSNLDERKRLYSALKWAEKNSNYDFKSIIKNAPVPGKLKFSNKEVYIFLLSFKKFMENEEYTLLTDDRPTTWPWENN
ncbi:hypothetical protein AAEO56_10420 [Flavobacterium sp. DGU11]|uniref:Uncharacterized protein n=1 Tax=Flavobacterium arundinis TaxID=3139143 RepID=A0ABU9HXQ0_9FLAO